MKIIFTFSLFIIISVQSFSQTTSEKLDFIIKELDLIKSKKDFYNFYIGDLKLQVSGQDSIDLNNIENQLTNTYIHNEIKSGFEKFLTEEEINQSYNFINSSAFDKLFKQNQFNDIMFNSFSEINEKLKTIKQNIDKKYVEDIKVNEFIPIPVDRINGLYATKRYDSENIENSELLDNPSITFDEIESVIEEINQYGEKVINVKLTKNGAVDFRDLTTKNIGKPIAIVINKKIISIPIVNEPIPNGSFQIIGNWNEEDIKSIISAMLNR